MASKEHVLLVVPARGGSKGLPRKNLARLGGMPLIGHAVRAALRTALVDEVVVSTDDAEIAEEASRFGATVITRPVSLSGDTASSESAISHAIDAVPEITGASAATIIVMLQCTAPFVSPHDIDGTIRLVRDESFDSAFAASSFQHFVWRYDRDRGAYGVNHNGRARIRRQDLDAEYLEVGSVYAMRASTFRSTGLRFCGDTGIYELSSHRCLEIDDENDLRRARALYPLIVSQNFLDYCPQHLGAVIFDFDGVFTNGKVLVDQCGRESVVCDRRDGLGLSKIKEAGIRMLVISKERNPVVEARCQKVGIEYYQGIDDKFSFLKEWVASQDFELDACVYVGDDENDLPSLRAVGCSVAPADAHISVIGEVDLVLTKDGGNGALREIADSLLNAVASGVGISKNSANLSQTVESENVAYQVGDCDERIWGRWRVHAVGPGYCVKHIEVKPGHRLSLQRHAHRAESWTIVAGSAEVEVDGTVKKLDVGDTVRIPMRSVHRIRCISESNLHFIEVQVGDKLDENDIERLQDDYGRASAS